MGLPKGSCVKPSAPIGSSFDSERTTLQISLHFGITELLPNQPLDLRDNNLRIHQQRSSPNGANKLLLHFNKCTPHYSCDVLHTSHPAANRGAVVLSPHGCLLQIIDFQYHASSATISTTLFRAWLTTLLSNKEKTIHAEINHKIIY